MLKRFRKSETPPAAPPGVLDETENGQVKGWAFDSKQPGTRFQIDLVIDGRTAQTITANQYRSDLLDAGIGDGYHAFSWLLPERFLDGTPHKLEAKISGTEAALEHSPRVAVFPRAPADPEAAAMPAPAQDKTHGRTLPDSLLHGLTVVIPTKNNGEQLERTLRACAARSRNLPVDLLVVDYGSTDSTAERLGSLAAEIPNLRSMVAAAPNACAARNTGVDAASREVILFLKDDVVPAVATFYEQHIHAHHMLPGRNVAVLGRVTWPNHPDDRVSFLMAHLQNGAERQLGAHAVMPNTWLDWRFFYPGNISFKRSVIADWSADGYRTDVPESPQLYDAELAYRVNQKTEGGFPILYVPSALATHQSATTVRQLIERQLESGVALRALFGQDPVAFEKLGVSKVARLLASPKIASGAGTEDFIRMIEGAKSWGVVIESGYQLGSQNWHADLIGAVSELSYLQGFVIGCPDPDANYQAAYQYCVERFQERLSTAASFEVFGRFPSFTLT